MTHEQACAALADAALRYGRDEISVHDWADEVSAIITRAYPDARERQLAHGRAGRELDLASRTRTLPRSRSRAADHNAAQAPAHAAAPDAP